MFIVCFGGFNFLIDPFWHYRNGLSYMQYPLLDERYINDGLQRHSSYEILITGTSMSQNMNPSKAESLWNMSALKTCYSGATYYELGKSIKQALSHNPNIKLIICSLDPSLMHSEYDEESYEGYPEYLYDSNPFNDVNYLLNKEVFLKSIAAINYTRARNMTPSPDEYGRFDKYRTFGKDAVLSVYDPNAHISELPEKPVLDEIEKEKIKKNIETNLISNALNNPDTEFVYYIPPYSCCYWDALVKTDQLEYATETIEYTVSLLSGYDNISVYCFDDMTEITCNLDNYCDVLHYNGAVSDLILEKIYDSKSRIDSKNAAEYFDNIRSIYKDIQIK